MTEQEQNPEMENFEVMSDTYSEQDPGRIQIADSVIEAIAKEAVMAVNGVAEIPDGDLLDGIAGMIGKKSAHRGINVNIDENDMVTIDLSVVLAYGVKIPVVAGQLQQVIKDSVEDLTGKDVLAVNVAVQGIKVIEASEED